MEGQIHTGNKDEITVFSLFYHKRVRCLVEGERDAEGVNGTKMMNGMVMLVFTPTTVVQVVKVKRLWTR